MLFGYVVDAPYVVVEPGAAIAAQTTLDPDRQQHTANRQQPDHPTHETRRQDRGRR
jgi:hypothetical protein